MVKAKRIDARVVDKERKRVAVSLLTWLTKHNLLLNNQSSYRPNISCITALIKLVDDLLSDIDKGSLNGLLLLDLRKAFDLINRNLLIEKLACYHLTESSLEWFRYYLNNRKQFVKLNNHSSSELVIRSGVPHGSILGSVLFIIFMNDINLSQVSDPLLPWYIYADDTTKRSTAKTIDNLRQTMFKDSKPLERWVLDSNGMVINMSKTKCMVVGTRARLQSQHSKCLNLSISDTPLSKLRNTSYSIWHSISI